MARRGRTEIVENEFGLIDRHRTASNSEPPVAHRLSNFFSREFSNDFFDLRRERKSFSGSYVTIRVTARKSKEKEGCNYLEKLKKWLPAPFPSLARKPFNELRRNDGRFGGRIPSL